MGYVIDHTEQGHVATCQQCGWRSRGHQVPDSAATAADRHTCQKPI